MLIVRSIKKPKPKQYLIFQVEKHRKFSLTPVYFPVYDCGKLLSISYTLLPKKKK